MSESDKDASESDKDTSESDKDTSESDRDNSGVYLQLAEHASQRYEALRNVEWKVDLGLWGFLIGANALIINAKDYSPSFFVSLIGTILVIVLCLLHMVWFQYIHEVQQRNNRTSYWWECKARMAAGEKHDELPKKCRPPADWEGPAGFSQEEAKLSKESKNWLRQKIQCLANQLNMHESHIMRLVVTAAFGLLLIPVLWDRH